MTVYYFGCKSQDEIGHYPYTPGMRRYPFTLLLTQIPWGTGVDGCLCPGGEHREGDAKLHYKDGWTAIAFWDRSADKRYGSNSVFLFDEVLTFSAAVERAREQFPEVWARFTFKVRL